MPAQKLISNAQERALLQLMQENPEYATNRKSHALPLAKQEMVAFWERVASQLNAMGCGITKAALKWRDYWTERKYVARKKAGRVRAHATGSGGGPAKAKLTDVEEAILEIIGKDAVNEEPSVKIPFGFGEPSTSQDMPASPPTATQPRTVTPKQQHSEHLLATEAPAWAIELEHRRVEAEIRRMEVQGRLAAAVERLATTQQTQTELLRLLLDVMRRRH